jgi:hypothetical protein
MVSDLVILAAACNVAEHHRGYGELYVWGKGLTCNSKGRIGQGFLGGCDDTWLLGAVEIAQDWVVAVADQRLRWLVLHFEILQLLNLRTFFITHGGRGRARFQQPVDDDGLGCLHQLEGLAQGLGVGVVRSQVVLTVPRAEVQIRAKHPGVSVFLTLALHQPIKAAVCAASSTLCCALMVCVDG